MDRPDLLFPFERRLCPRCLLDVLVQPVGPTICPACEVDVTKPAGLPSPSAPSRPPRPDPFWDGLK
ncbi:MAG TPA: hypothetical protein VEI97_08330 [bacterium]|nr:hypothetical protein [bacterium]